MGEYDPFGRKAKLNRLIAKPEHEVAYQDLCELISKHVDEITAIEMLAIAANMLGKLAAMQDQRLYTTEEILTVIANNLQYGNKHIVEQLLSDTEGNA